VKLPYHIERILKDNKITDFLAKRGIHPVKELSGKSIYHCPIHTGDNEPSFMVYTDQEYQTYFCYACKTGTNIINLVSDLDNISIKYAVFKLSRDLGITDEEIINSIIDDIENNEISKSEKENEINILFLKINKICYNYLNDVNFDKEEIEFTSDFFKNLDKAVSERNLQLIGEMCDSFIEKELPLRAKEYTERIESQCQKK